MSNSPDRPPPVFSYPAAKVPFAEFEVAVFSDPEAVKMTASMRHVIRLKMTKGQWRFRSRYPHQIHHVEAVKLAAKAAMEEVIWRARLLPPFNEGKPEFIGYITLPGSPSFPMRTYLVLELAPHNFACVARRDGPLLGHAERQAFTENQDDYQDSFTPAVRRWMQDFGAHITPGWDRPENTSINSFNVIQDSSDESSLPMPVPAMFVSAVLDLSSEDAESVGSNIALPGSPLAASPGSAAFNNALAIVQAPLSLEDVQPVSPGSPMEDDTIEFIEE